MAKHTRRHTRKQAHKANPWTNLEVLEPRLLLTTYYVPDTIDYTGATEVTSAIQAYLDSVPNGTQQSPNTIVFHQDGNYHIEGTLHVEGRIGLTIDGNGALFNADRPLINDNGDDDTFTGTDGAAWNSHWTWEGTPTTNIISGNSGKLTPTTVPPDWVYGLAKINNASNTEADLTCTFKADTSQAKFGLFGRRSTTYTTDYYYCNIEAGQNYIQIVRVSNGVETQVGVATGPTVAANTNYTVQFQCLQDGTHVDLRAKYWQTGQTVPGWMVDTTDSDPRLQNLLTNCRGGMWFGFKGAGSTYVDDFVVNGDGGLGTRSQWEIGGAAAYITLKNMDIDGALTEGEGYDVNREGQHAVDLGTLAHDILVDNVHATHLYGDGFYANGGAHDLIVQNSYFAWTGRQGLSVCNNYNVLVYNNYIGNANRSLFDIEPYGDNWSVDNLRIIGNTTGSAGNGWVTLHDDIGSLYVANNTANGPYGDQFFKAQGDGTTGYRGPMVVVNNTLTAVGNLNDFESVDLAGMVFMGNQVTYPASTGGTAMQVSGSTASGAVVGNNRFANIADPVYVSNIIKDIVTWDNTTASGAWSSSTTVTELSDSYFFSSPYSNGAIQNGSVLTILRKFVGSTAVTYNNLTTTGQMATVLLDSHGNVVSGWTSGGTANYNGAELPLLAVAPTVLTPPQSQTVVAGQAVTFNVVSAGSSPMSYQWTKNGTVIADATSNSYTFTAASGDNNAQFACVITNKYGSVASSAATLTVSAAVAPTITTNPVAASISTGYTATFTVAASGPGPLSYQWQKNSVNITGATATTYVTPVTVLGDSGSTFRCVVTNASGSTNSTAATLTVSDVTTSETWTGANGAAWPSQWIVSNPTNEVVDIQSNAGDIKYSAASGTVVAALDPAGTSFHATIDSVQQTSIYCASATNNMEGGLIARRADANPSLYYSARLDMGSGVGKVLRISRGGTELAVSATGIWANITWYKMKFSVQSIDASTTELKAKLWLATDSEPTDWTLTVNDTDPTLQGVAGRVGVHAKVVSSGARYWRFDDYSFTPPTSGASAPASASGLAAALQSGSHVRLTWQDNSGNEDGFIVQRSTDGTNFSDRAYVSQNVTAYTDTGLSANTRYYYRIRAYNTQGFAADSAAVRVTTPDAAVNSIAESWTGANGDAWTEKWTFEGNTAQVANKDIQSNAGRILCNSSASGGLIAYDNQAQSEGVDQTVTFRADGNGAGAGFVARRVDADTYYYIRATAGSDQLLFYKVVDGTSTQLAAIKASTVTAGTDYKIRFLCQTNGAATDLKAKLWLAASGEPGTWSAAITDSEPTLQNIAGRFGLRYELSNSRTITVDDYSGSFTATSSSVGSLTATAASATQINLAWTDNSGNETGYRVERSPNGHDTWTAIATTAANATSYSSSGLMPSTPYWYRVTPVNASGTGANPLVATAITQDVVGDVREYFTADDGATWPAKWTFEGSTEGARSVYRNAGMIDGGSTGNILAFVNNSNQEDTNQVVKYTISSTGANLGLITRRSDANSDTYYYLYTESNGTKLKLYKSVDGVATMLGVKDLGTSNYGGYLRLSCQTNGATTDLKAKFWATGNPEPIAWNLELSNNEPALQGVSGRSGAYFQLFSGRTMTIDNYVCSSGSFMSAPAAPTGLSATAASPGQINLAWTDASSNESGFAIERSPDGSTGWTQIALVPPATTAYSDTGLTANTAYYYRVKAYNGTADSSYTSNANATTLIAIPAAPTNLSATPYSYNRIDLAWTDTSSNETGFKIERSDDGGFTFNQIGTVGAGVTTYQSTGLSATTTYHYRVRAYNGSGDSAYSNITNATTPVASAVVTISATDASAAEAGPDAGTFTVTRNGTSGDLVVNYTISGSAAGGDYTPTLGGTVTIPNGQTSANIVITPVNDTLAELNEALILTLGSGTGYTVGSPSAATVTITDNDTLAMPTSLVALWTFDEASGTSTYDTSGSSIADTGTLQSTPTWEAGRIGTALHFNGSNQYVQVANSTDIRITGSITLACWAKSDVTNWNSSTSLVTKRNAYVLGGVGGGKNVQFTLYINNVWCPLTYTPPSIDLTQWHHYAASYDGANMRLYIDGSLVATQAQTGTIYSDPGVLTIGRDDGNPRYFDGMMDETRIYNTKLSDTEIAALAGQAALSVTGLTVNSSNAADYSVQPYALATAMNQYGDRTDTFTTIPGKYLGGTLIRTADDDAMTVNSQLLTFTVNRDVTVYILYNDSYTNKPAWLSQFTDTTDNVVTTHGTFSVYKKVLSAGTITLGGNTDNGIGDFGMYSVLIVPVL